MHSLKLAIPLCLTLLAAAAPCFAGHTSPSLLEATLKDVTCQGRLEGRDDDICWLMGRDGRLYRIKIKNIQKIESIDPKFRKYSSAELRDLLRREYGKEMEVVGTGHYLVCAPHAVARRYAGLFEEIYRSVHLYFSRRGFRIEEPEFPLIAVVYPDRSAFAVQCRQDEVRFSPGLLGYYHPDTNRVALFDSSTETTGEIEMPTGRALSFEQQFSKQTRLDRTLGFQDLSSVTRNNIAAAGPQLNDIAPDLEDVMIHETIHQVAFNIGLHSRIGDNPRWVVEGLATALEASGMLTSVPTDKLLDRANHYRLMWFTKYAQSRRKPKSLVEFIASDKKYASAAPDAYSEGWALTFFLLETRAGKYSSYLRTIAARDPKLPYTAEDRVEDFRNAFGGDFDLLEAEYLRFITRLQ